MVNVVLPERQRSIQSLWQLSQSFCYSYCINIFCSSICLCWSWRIFLDMCIWLCEVRPVQPSGQEPALVQNYASVNVSCWSADSKKEINKRWQREDPHRKEALEKDFSPWDWLHMHGELSLLKPYKIPGQGLSVPTHLDLSSAGR